MKIRLWFYGIVITLLYGALWIQPYEFDFVVRKVHSPYPMVDPDTKTLFKKGTKILVVTAHPDDSEFFIGGLLAKLSQTGAELHQVICTDGDKGYYLFFTNAKENRRVRREEAHAAAAAWHAQSLLMLGYPDRFLHANQEVIDKVAAEMARIKPEYVLTFDGNYPVRMSHQDHRRAGDIALAAAKRTPSVKWVMMFQTSSPNYVFDISDLWEDQKRLLEIHKSQFFGAKLPMVENMVASTAERDGERIGVGLGEGLRCIRP